MTSEWSPQTLSGADNGRLATVITTGSRIDEAPKEVRQVYIPRSVHSTGDIHGPFRQLLYPLLSTGTQDYNHSKYDKCPLSLSVGIQSDLVDITSFEEADSNILSSPLGRRDLYVIDEAIPWMELAQRECKLFGYHEASVELRLMSQD